MSRLVIFGDSFAAKKLEEDEYGWYHSLKSFLECEEDTLNYAYSGSSFHYSLDRLSEYLDNDYDKNDYILFFVTQLERNAFMHPDADPSWSTYLRDLSFGGNPKFTGPKCRKHFKIYSREYIFMNQFIMTRERMKFQYQMFNKTFESLENKKLIVQCFHNDFLSDKNHFNLFDISQKEFMDPTIDKAMNDTRFNHFSPENHIILATRLRDALLYGTKLKSHGFIERIYE